LVDALISKFHGGPSRVLDAKGLNCPLSILKANEAPKDLPVGATLEVLATDRGSVADFEAFCRARGNELIESTQDKDVYRFIIKASPLTEAELHGQLPQFRSPGSS
jgi:tRNA 2-thiouridine synthesizing protein A